MAAPTFLQILKTTVAQFQAAHPDREGELARAHALILHGMVTASPDDPETGRVLSSDMTTTYHVNGACNCQAGAHGKDCKHSQAWKLYRYVERKLAAQTAPEPEVVAFCDNFPPALPEVHGDSHTPPPLGEAPASVNVHLMIDGRDCLVTLRDHDETRLLKRLQAVLAQYPPGQTALQRGPTPGQDGWCSLHNVALKETTKNGHTWKSHKTATGWCKGR